MSYRFHPEALEAYQEATLYYAERDAALALRFVEAVEDAIRRILEAPQRWRVLDDDVRRCLTRVFPYGVLYTIEPVLLP
jgi:plasmid stabilization system protein ParE